VLVVIDVFDDLSALPGDLQLHIRATLGRMRDAPSEPAIIARVHATEDPYGDRLDEPGRLVWAIGFAGEPVKPGDVMDTAPNARRSSSTSVSVAVSPAGEHVTGPVIYIDRLIVVRRAKDQ
jgi:hypothetical protein